MTRTWVLEDHGRRPLTVNGVAGMHRQQWATVTRQDRTYWRLLAAQQNLPRGLQRVSIVATPLHRDRRSPQDVAACAPAVKAAVDGLVDHGLIPDDNPDHLLEITFRPPEVCGADGLRLLIRDHGPTP